MFEEAIDLDAFYGLPSSSALGILIQISATDREEMTLHHLTLYFSDHQNMLREAIDELQFLGLLHAEETNMYGTDTLRLTITMPGHIYLSGFAEKLNYQYKSYFSE
jgi:hypothetical protein